MAFPIKNAFLLYLVLLTTSSQCSKLNVPRVLLPIFNDFSSKFILEATEGGCYRWSTTRQDLIEISPINEDSVHKCSTKVFVIAITKEMARNIAVILAEDVHTKQMLRSDVIVDVIHSIAVSTTTRELFMEEAPEDFHVIAYDDQGNEFSTLEDIEFNWEIQTAGPNKDTILRYIPYRDSRYETPHAIAEMEDVGKKGYTILLEGIKSGSAKISVHLPYTEYKHVQPYEVQLMVVANLLLSPAEIYMMQGDSHHFKIFYLNNGYMEEIPLKNSQYYLQAEDETILSTTRNSGQVTAKTEGTTKILLHDRNVVESDPALKLPSAIVHVVLPHYLTINLLPHKNWAILAGDFHQIAVEVYSQDDHKIHIGGTQIELNVDSDYFSIVSQTYNGSWASGFGIKVGITTVQASLRLFVSALNDYVAVTARNELLIYPAITVNPSPVVLPWDPLIKPKYDIPLAAEGGDGKFSWSTSDASIGVVSQSGNVHTQSNGVFQVIASMQQNYHIQGSSLILISPPNRLEIVEYLMETEVGKTIHLHVALHVDYTDANGSIISMPVWKCQDFPFRIRQTDDKFFYNRSDVVSPVGLACGNLAMSATDVGRSKITVYYERDDMILEDSVTLSAYKPLNLLQPKEQIVLAVGSGINLVYSGGPQSGIGPSNDFQRIVVSGDEDLVEAFDVTDRHKFEYNEDYTIVNVLCKKYGETDVKLMVSNSPVMKNCKPQSDSIITRVICARPTEILLKPELEVENSENCPMDWNRGSVLVHKGDDLRVEVLVLNENGVKFLNISSLMLKWDVEPLKDVQVLHKSNAFPQNISVGSVEIAYKQYQIVHLHDSLPKGTVNVTVTGYNRAVLKQQLLSVDDFELSLKNKQITASLQLLVANDMQISPKHLQIFNHPNNRRVINIQHGSGFFELSLNIENLAKIKYRENHRQIEVIPIRPGELLIEVNDLCLSSAPVRVHVNILTIEYVRPEMSDKVEIGKSIECVVRLFDFNENLITQTSLIDIKGVLDKANIAGIQKVNSKSSDSGEIRFVLTGNEVGETKLVFAVNNGENEVRSAPINVQVFEPLKLLPRNSTILIGSVLQFTVVGGPQSEAHTIFSSENGKYVQVNENGVVKGRKLGLTRIYAKSVGTHPNTGEMIQYSEDSVEVHVVELIDIKIEAPLTRFQVGAKVPFWCYGLPNISPLILGSIDEEAGAQFHWHVEDGSLAEINGVFHDLGIDLNTKNQLSIQLVGLKPGKTHLILNTTLPGSVINKPFLSTVILTSQIEIEVIPSFYLIEPKRLPNLQHLLIGPFSKMQLKTNLDAYRHTFVYTLSNSVPSAESLTGKSVVLTQNLITLSPSGVVESFGTFGHSMVIITATDENNIKQNILIAIEVKAIHYMNVEVNANWRIRATNPLEFIPLGSVLNLQLTYHDDLGNRFDAGPSQVKGKTNRNDLMKVSLNGAKVTIQSKLVGSTVLKLTGIGLQKNVYYLKLPVGQTIRPSMDYLMGGDVICLTTPIVDENGAKGRWLTSDKNVVRMDGEFNNVGFVGERNGEATLTYSLLPASPLNVRVSQVNKIEVEMNEAKVISGDLGAISYFPVVLYNNAENIRKTGNNFASKKCRQEILKSVTPSAFKCFVQFTNQSNEFSVDDLFEVVPGWITETGQYACKLIDKGVNTAKSSLIRTNLSVWVTTEDEEIQSSTLQIDLYPRFYAPVEIHMPDDQNDVVLNIIGTSEVLNQLTVKAADEKMVYITSGVQSSETNVRYTVQLIDNYWISSERLEIVVYSPLTRQTASVLLKVTNTNRQICYANRSGLLDLMSSYKNIFVVIIVILAITIPSIYFLVYANYAQPAASTDLNSHLIGSTPIQRHQAPVYLSRLGNSSPTTGLNVSNVGHNISASFTREPIYGEASSFYNTSLNSRRGRQNL